MAKKKLSRLSPSLPRLIAVVHLPALAGAPGASGLSASEALQQAGMRAVEEARAFQAAGFEAVILENFGDIPFYRDQVPPETVASLAVIAAAVREAVTIPIGINVLRNDARSALAIAATTGCDFIRVNVISGVAATDQGIIEGHAAELLRERARLGAGFVRILADAHVKHARQLSSDDIELAIEEARLRAGADGVIVTGATTGRSIAPSELERASRAAKHCGAPLYIGSGASAETIGTLAPFLHGVIVSSTLRKNGRAGEKLDPARIRAFIQAYKKATARGASAKKAPKKRRKA